MTTLKYKMTNDILFKLLFVKNPDLLKRLVAELLGIRLEDIGQFEITNPEMPPESLGDKFCRLDINMTVDGQRVDLEIQVADEGDYPERSLYYWAREYSSALGEGKDYRALPRTVVVSIVTFKLFSCAEYHSEYQPLEVTRHTSLTDKQAMHYFELPKLPEAVDAGDELKLWLTLFKAETEEELRKIEDLGVPVMEQAIQAYRHITATDEFKEMERLRSLARHNEAAALRHAAEVEREKWRGVVADKDAVIADRDAVIAGKDAALADKDAALADKDAALADKDAALADKDAQIAELLAQLGEGQ
ncbi:MAG: Rpn family recombination-promoting nuclease/putative transposase [Clostridiales bacterium]|nr:Rpn family recombination-promoting nuclease/putative transposase [Clostridiales bacterium]